MARIRSIHPGFWTDEAVVSVSVTARLFFIGLWNQCDDKGVFEWKPVGLRMRIFPADLIDAQTLLKELIEADLIRGYQADGRHYGVVRNFAAYQRPKKPNSLYPLPEQFNLFSGLTSDGSPRVRNQGPEGGGSSKEGIPPTSVSPKKSRPKKAKPTPTNGGDHDDAQFRDGYTASAAADLRRITTDAEAGHARSGRAGVVHFPGRPDVHKRLAAGG